jgi:hypothetical protein
MLEPEAGAQDRGQSGLGGEALDLPAREPGRVNLLLLEYRLTETARERSSRQNRGVMSEYR